MNLLNNLTIKNLKLNKKRTIVTIIGIILSVALLTAVSSMYYSTLQSLINLEKYDRGDFHVMYKDVPREEIITIKNNRKIEGAYLTKDIGYAKLEESKNEYKPYAFIKGFTKESLEHLSIKLKSGRLPENDSEILIPTHLKTNGRIELNVGDTITLEVGKRICGDMEYTQDYPYSPECNVYNGEDTDVTIVPEKITETTTKEYKIVGIIERPAKNIEAYDAPGYTFATLINEEEIDNSNVYVKYNKLGKKNYYKTTAEILGVDPVIFEKLVTGEYEYYQDYLEASENIENNSKYDMVVNDYLLLLETDPLGKNTMSGLLIVVIIVSVIIIVSSVVCIKNSFDISIVEKTKQYGILRSIGATKKQIRKNVLFEAFVLGIIGIPLGVILGLLASFILCMVCNYLLQGSLTEGFKISLVINIIALMLSIVLGIITIYLSAIKSAWKASHISPIDSIRNSGEIKIKKQYNSKIINKLFGIGGVISYKNIKRNKKKYRTTVISIIISTTIFIALTYFVTLFYDTIKEEFRNNDYNISYSIRIEDENDKKLLKDTISLDLVEDYVLNRNLYLDVENIKLSKSKYFQKELNDMGYTIEVISIGDYQYEKYIKELKLSDDIKDKGILYDYITFKNEKNRETLHVLDYKKGDKITVDYNNFFSENDIVEEEKYEIELGAIVEKLPFGKSKVEIPLLILSDSLFNKYFNDYDYYNVFVKASNADKYQDTLLKEIIPEEKNIMVTNWDEEQQIIKNLLLLMCIFLYGFIIVVTLIGITNIFNTITTNMELRKPEFAMLKSIGMTTKEFLKMIKLESIFICVKALIISIVLGVGISYLIYYKLAYGTGMRFVIPVIPIIGAIVGVVLLIYILMKFSISKINKQNTIETIRNENI